MIIITNISIEVISYEYFIFGENIAIGIVSNHFTLGVKYISISIGNVQTPVIQGTFDIESIFNLTAGLKWNFANDKLSLSARCNDIFDTGMPATKVRFKGQHLDMNSGFYSRSFTLHSFL